MKTRSSCGEAAVFLWLRRFLNGLSFGGNDLGRPQNRCGLREPVTQVLISLHLNLWSTPSVYRSRRPLESPLARIRRVYQCLALHTVTRRHINTGAHENSNTHCLCVSLSSQIRKHDIIFSVCLCTCARTHTRAQMHFRRGVRAPMCPNC